MKNSGGLLLLLLLLRNFDKEKEPFIGKLQLYTHFANFEWGLSYR